MSFNQPIGTPHPISPWATILLLLAAPVTMVAMGSLYCAYVLNL